RRMTYSTSRAAAHGEANVCSMVAGPTDKRQAPIEDFSSYAGRAPLLIQNSLSDCCTLRYQMMLPISGNRNQRPQSGVTGLWRPSRSYMFLISFGIVNMRTIERMM